MRGLREAPIDHPPVADEDAGEVGAQQRGRVVEAAARRDAKDGGRRRGRDPQPVQHAAHFPAGFIGRHHRTAAHLGAERGIGRRRARSGARTQVDEAAARDREAVLRGEHAADLAERHPQPLVQPHRERRRPRAEGGAGRAERVRGLQRMASLHAVPAAAARADRHAKRAHHGRHRRQISWHWVATCVGVIPSPQSGHTAGSGASWVCRSAGGGADARDGVGRAARRRGDRPCPGAALSRRARPGGTRHVARRRADPSTDPAHAAGDRARAPAGPARAPRDRAPVDSAPTRRASAHSPGAGRRASRRQAW